MVEKLIRKTKNLLRKLFHSGQFIIWRVVGIFKSTKPTEEENDWQLYDWQRILVIQLNAIGDLVMTTPALRCLRQRFSQAQIDALVRPHTKEILYNNPRVNNIYAIERQPLQRKSSNFATIGNSIKTIRMLRKRRYDLSIDFSGQFSTAWISFLIGAKHRLGPKRNLKLGWFNINSFDYLYTKELTLKNNFHHIEQNIQLLHPLGCVSINSKPEIFPQVDNFDREQKLFQTAGGNGCHKVVCIHPGAKWPPKRWPEKNYGELIRRLCQHGCRVLLVGCGDEDLAATTRIIGYSNSTPINLVNKLSLAQTAALITKCHLFIGNDSGPMHLAAAVGIPSVLLFGPVAPKTIAPRSDRAVVFYKNTECSPCTLYFTKDKCQQGNNICMQMITVDEVWKAVCSQLSAFIDSYDSCTTLN